MLLAIARFVVLLTMSVYSAISSAETQYHTSTSNITVIWERDIPYTDFNITVFCCSTSVRACPDVGSINPFIIIALSFSIRGALGKVRSCQASATRQHLRALLVVRLLTGSTVLTSLVPGVAYQQYGTYSGKGTRKETSSYVVNLLVLNGSPQLL